TLNSRRKFLSCGSIALGTLSASPLQTLFAQTSTADRDIRITGMEVFTVGVTGRTNWIIVRLNTNSGTTGLGEASLGRRTELNELNEFFALVDGESAFDIQQYRQRGRSRAAVGNRVIATAFSAIEQALWDIVGKTLDVPLYQLFGGKLHDSLPVYANINRATADRVPQGFAEKAQQAVADGFRAIKAAPFDGFPPLTAPSDEIARARDLGIASVYAMREAVGNDIKIKIDAHSFFDVAMSIDVARELEAASLSWYEEPVAPTLTEDTKTIHDAIEQTLAGGEFLFGIEGFAPLCANQAVDIIMPDVKHCGGLLEAQKIGTLAEAAGINVSPHNPSGPIATAASVNLCAALPNFEILEYQWGEANWRADLIEPAEVFEDGNIRVGERTGIGITLNGTVLSTHSV
ncbi:MAG TPA: mandelate racemase/muconate lactonizing enzyme family protein, partial [Gammaproteobacteria bacterium]|nr:mandelate racemase/muconate lactonizing enzyme family protein [Gammaproteobacteria bacterium]